MHLRPEKKEALKQRMEELEIFESDLDERFILGSGKGGQKVNKTASCVYLKHLPTGLEVKCQQDRSREMNRYFARRMLCDKIEEERNEKESAKAREIAKLRKQKKRRSRRTQAKILDDKRRHSEKKQLRQNPRRSDAD